MKLSCFEPNKMYNGAKRILVDGSNLSTLYNSDDDVDVDSMYRIFAGKRCNQNNCRDGGTT